MPFTWFSIGKESRLYYNLTPELHWLSFQAQIVRPPHYYWCLHSLPFVTHGRLYDLLAVITLYPNLTRKIWLVLQHLKFAATFFLNFVWNFQVWPHKNPIELANSAEFLIFVFCLAHHSVTYMFHCELHCSNNNYWIFMCVSLWALAVHKTV